MRIPACSEQTVLVTYTKNHTEQTLPTLSAWEQKVPFENIYWQQALEHISKAVFVALPTQSRPITSLSYSIEIQFLICTLDYADTIVHVLNCTDLCNKIPTGNKTKIQ